VKHLLIILLSCTFVYKCSSQYYLRGIVHDEKGKGLNRVHLYLRSKGNYPYYTGTTGAFGIPVSVAQDTLTLEYEGFKTLKWPVESAKFQDVALKMLPVIQNQNKRRLISITKDKKNEQHSGIFYNGGESYSSFTENKFVEATEYPHTGFTVNVDRASYSNIRRFLNVDSRVPPDAVRIEEMLNYFSFPIAGADRKSKKFSCQTRLTSCPWNINNELLFVNLQAPSIDFSNVPPSNLIFLIDVSGSMDQANRLPLLKSAFKSLVDNLRAQDTVAIVIYGGGVSVWLPPTSGAEKVTIKEAIEKLQADGETPGEQAIHTAYALAERSFNHQANNRVILATDGDFNIGQTSEKELEDIIGMHRQSGIFLTCIGVGMGNYKDSKLEALAKRGNGNFAYLDNPHEAEKVMITEFSKTMYAVATDCFASVTFNNAMVKRYRLIGFDNKTDAVQDNASQLEGGEVGTGHNLVAVFEIEPTPKNIEAVTEEIKDDDIAQVVLQYKLPGLPEAQTQEFKVKNEYIEMENADSSTRFAASLVMFGEFLRMSENAKNYTIDDISQLAKSAADKKDYSQAEFINMLELAKKIYNPNKRKKEKN
jgi:Ca-activated chloride channel family protein